MAKAGLGRGLGSLIPDNFDSSILLDEHDRVQRIPVTQLVPGASQPRQHFDDEALKELATSIERHGVLQPLVVVRQQGEQYAIIAGERRWRAAQLAKINRVPVIVRTLKEIEQLEIALIENVQRVDLSPLEQAASVERLHQDFNLTYEQIAQRLGKSVPTLSNTVRLLQLPPAAQQALTAKDITEGHARAILALKGDAVQQSQLLKLIIEQGWSVRQAERYVTGVKSGAQNQQAAKARVATETPETKQLGKQLRTDVQIRRMAKGGRLEITFKSDEDLARILGTLG